MCFRRFHLPRHLSGFTAIELLVAIAIIAVLAAIAAPSFTPLIERWRVRQVTEELQSTLYFARSEAIKRSGGITIDASAGWDQGWKVTHTQGSSTTTLQVSGAPVKVGVTLAGGNGKITVDRWGMLMHSGSTTTTALDFTIAPDSSNTASTLHLCVGTGGRIVQKSSC
jgi:type IV fimbrial biogenesis protein FimT